MNGPGIVHLLLKYDSEKKHFRVASLAPCIFCLELLIDVFSPINMTNWEAIYRFVDGTISFCHKIRVKLGWAPFFKVIMNH